MKKLFMGVALMGFLGSGAAWAADKPVGLQGSHGQSQLSAQASSMLPLCASCHGLEGVSSEGMYPNLAGQKVEYLVKQGVRYAAGIPGHGAWTLTDALLDRPELVRLVLQHSLQFLIHRQRVGPFAGPPDSTPSFASHAPPYA